MSDDINWDEETERFRHRFHGDREALERRLTMARRCVHLAGRASRDLVLMLAHPNLILSPDGVHQLLTMSTVLEGLAMQALSETAFELAKAMVSALPPEQQEGNATPHMVRWCEHGGDLPPVLAERFAVMEEWHERLSEALALADAQAKEMAQAAALGEIGVPVPPWEKGH